MSMTSLVAVVALVQAKALKNSLYAARGEFICYQMVSVISYKLDQVRNRIGKLEFT